MKLRHKIMILLAIPVLFQVCTVALFFQAVSQVDVASRKEQRAKKIISLSQDMHGQVGLIVLRVMTSTFNTEDPRQASTDLMNKMSADLQQLHILIPPGSEGYQQLSRLDNCTALFLRDLLSITKSYVPGNDKAYFARFLYKDDFMDALEKNYVGLLTEVQNLIALYEPISSELSPEGAGLRAGLRNAMAALAIATVILVTTFGLAVNRQVFERLRQLMNNIHLFAKGEKSLVPLSGRDELAELDESFRRISAQKFLLDEVQKSLRAMVSHDLRSPLGSISISLEMILDQRADNLDEKSLTILRRAFSEVQRLSRLARTLLDIEKLEGGHIKVDTVEISSADLVDASVNAVVSLAERKGVVIENRLGNEVSVKCDEDRTIQCVVNLLSNAIKFSPRDSVVLLQERLCPGGIWRLEVVDRGPGVPASATASLFVKFAQLDQPESVRAEGTGLGLYICRLLMEAQYGRVGYEPAQPLGSCFWLELPMVGASPAAATGDCSPDAQIDNEPAPSSSEPSHHQVKGGGNNRLDRRLLAVIAVSTLLLGGLIYVLFERSKLPPQSSQSVSVSAAGGKVIPSELASEIVQHLPQPVDGPEALRLLDESLPSLKDDRVMFKALYAHVIACRKARRWQDAEQDLERMLAMCAALPVPPETECTLTRDLALSCNELNLPEKAKPAAMRAVALCDGTKNYAVALYEQMAAVLLECGEPAAAASSLEKAFLLQTPDKSTLTLMHATLARAYSQLGEPEKGVAHLQAAVEASVMRRIVSRAAIAEIKALRNQGKTEAAAKLYAWLADSAGKRDTKNLKGWLLLVDADAALHDRHNAAAAKTIYERADNAFAATDGDRTLARIGIGECEIALGARATGLGKLEAAFEFGRLHNLLLSDRRAVCDFLAREYGRAGDQKKVQFWTQQKAVVD